MTLTVKDIQTLKVVVSEVVTVIVTDIVAEAIDDLKLQTAAGFAEVHTKIDSLQNTVDRIERVQMAEIQRSDRQDLAINHIRTALHSA